MRSALGILFVLATLGASARHPASSRPHSPGHSMTYLALGDSYTIGEGVEPAERWPVRLAALLRRRGRPVAEPEIVARTGWTTDELSAAIEARTLAPRWDLVTLLIGVNNQYRGRSLEEYRSQFRVLLARAVRFAGGDADHVLVVSIPDWGVTRFAAGRDRAAIGREIDAFNSIARAEALAHGARWADVTALSRRHGDDPAFLAADGLHPSAATYAEWAAIADSALAAPPASRP